MLTIRHIVLWYLGGAAFFCLLPAAHPVTDVAVAPLFLLVPVGWGLAYLSVCGHRWRMPEFSLPYLYLSAFLFGVVARTLVYQVFERSGWLQTLYGIMFPLDLFLSWWGWIRWRESMSFRPRSPQEWWLVGGLLSLVLVLYSFYYLKFTQFPLRDIFQETHFMKGAVELARFHILNPYTADSYIPMLQVQLGMLHGWYGFDLLISQWLLPPLNAAIRIAALYCFWRTVAPGVYSRMIALGLSMIALQNLFSPTNGDLLFSLCLLFMSLVIMDGRRTGGEFGSNSACWGCLPAVPCCTARRPSGISGMPYCRCMSSSLGCSGVGCLTLP